MKNKIGLLLLLIAFSGSACAKKNTYATPDFDVTKMDVSAKDGAANVPIVRSQLDSGPTYKMTGVSNDITRIDKVLTCGPVTLTSRTVLGSDPHAFEFQISDVEFPGLNQLPINPHCMMEITAANSNGSQFTKNVPLVLRFDTQALVIISHVRAERGWNPILSGNEIPVESFQIQNTQKLPINFIFRPANFTGVGTCLWDSPTTLWHTYRGQPFDIKSDRIQFDPPNVIPTGDVVLGLRFTLKGDQSVSITTFSKASPDCTGPKTIQAGTLGAAKGSFIYSLTNLGTLFQQRDFTPSDEDNLNPIGATITSDQVFTGTQRGVQSPQEIMAFPTN
jgi:hypothetical protein